MSGLRSTASLRKNTKGTSGLTGPLDNLANYTKKAQEARGEEIADKIGYRHIKGK